ncbi:Sjogren's syndrome/scleroderma autoantigen 1 family protein [Methanocaldococcus sp.]
MMSEEYIISLISSLLLEGYTMTDKFCPYCGSPIMRKGDKTFCPVCRSI